MLEKAPKGSKRAPRGFMQGKKGYDAFFPLLGCLNATKRFSTARLRGSSQMQGYEPFSAFESACPPHSYLALGF